ncbi:flavin-containing monooxygenase [Nocardia sp. alder85J]|uniref:flavin-containing monooxygenase n=1 Tax=Nocardia sp. alder85J TaxID=2862949 RepID=UPI001CD65ED9|nr:NAD(P)/FAD-dependent oxidoreductase [Nocardia sp. alder85J]MCX4094330.1 NAD(P)/FAD-dependent oxidoreductase [Nocardia sp. alder85J]
MSDPIRVDVLIIGAGFAGLGMGIRLARRGRESFMIIEQAGDVGGTWRDNRYPGVASDVPAHLYSFSFRPNPQWQRVFAEGAEIHQYLRGCVEQEGLEPHLLLNCALHQARWNDAEARWLVSTTRGEFSAANLVVATGRLTEPKLPPIRGLGEFGGRHWHSAQWNPKVSLVGKRVGLVGSGASAVQILPRLAQEAGEVVVFQRSAPYVLPRGDRRYTRDELSRFATDPDAITVLRDELFAEAERGIGARRWHHPDTDLLRQRALHHLATQVPDPRLRRELTPDYEIGCKRILFSDDYYAALQFGHVRLEPTALTEVRDGAVVAAGGRDYAVEVLIFATGFDTTRPAVSRNIFGRNGLPLAERWSDGMIAHATTTVDRFPNMYILDGPNAALGHNSAIYVIEAQIDYVLGALDHLAATAHRVLEVTAEAVQSTARHIDELARETVWTQGGCSSWYRDARTGRLTLLWPDSATAFRQSNATFDVAAYRSSTG